MKRQHLPLIITMMVILVAPAISQSSAAGGQWSGSIQCQLEVQVQGYARQEIQTWALTGEPPRTAGTGGVAVYPATWTYTGQGGLQRMDGPQMKSIQWAINIVPGEAPLAFVVRDGVLTIRRGSEQQKRYSGLTGQRQVAVNGMVQPPTPLTTFTLWEWPLPYIEAAPGANVSGTMTVPTDSFGGGEITSPVSGARPSANCKYQFTKAGVAGLTPVAQSCAVTQKFEEMKAYLAQGYDALIQQDPSRRIALNAQKQRLLHELDTQEQQNAGQSCRGGAGGTTTAGGGTAAGAAGTATNGGSGGAASGAAGAANSQGGAASSGAGAGANSSQAGAAANGTAGAGASNSQAGAAANGAAAGASNSQSAGGAAGAGAAAQNSGVPRLVKVDPASADQNTPNLQVALKGDSTHWLMGTSKLDFGPGITTVAGPFFTSATDAYVVIAVASDATVGQRTVTVTSPYPGKTESVALPNSFNVTAPSLMTGMTAVPLNIPVATLNTSTPQASSSTPAIDFAALKNNHPTKQLKGPSTTPSTSTSGNYLVTMTGLRCIMAYGEDDFFKGDGKGDEIYASAYIRHYDRNSFNELETGSLRKTMPYGDINKFPERVKAGHASNTGGIGGGDSIPDSASVDRRQPASQHVFPFELYNGQLANGVDALVISPSIWEYDGDSGTDYNDFFLAWAQHQQSMNASIFRDPLVQSQISNNSFGPVILANLASPPDQFRYGPINNRRDQPIGMVQNGYQSWALPDATIVLTREMIEHVLSSPFAPMVPTYPPAAPIYIPKPGIMVINFSGPNNRGGFYSMIVQVERQ